MPVLYIFDAEHQKKCGISAFFGQLFFHTKDLTGKTISPNRADLSRFLNGREQPSLWPEYWGLAALLLCPVYVYLSGCFQKWWVSPTNPWGFPTNWGYPYFWKHPSRYIQYIYIYMSNLFLRKIQQWPEHLDL